MKSLLALTTCFFFIISCSAPEPDNSGFVKIKSQNTVEETVSKLEQALEDKGMTIFNKIDHSEGAENAGLSLRPTVLVIFGNPEVGTKLMQCDQKMGIELPMKILVWEDQNGVAYVGYYDPEVYPDYYSLNDCIKIIEKVQKALSNFANAAAK